MARLIEELKKDHAAIAALLDRVKDPNVTNSEAHKILLSAKASLLAHLKKEDVQLYPVLHPGCEYLQPQPQLNAAPAPHLKRLHAPPSC